MDFVQVTLTLIRSTLSGSHNNPVHTKSYLESILIIYFLLYLKFPSNLSASGLTL